MKIITGLLEGSALDWAVAQALGYTDVQITGFDMPGEPEECFFRPGKYDAAGHQICGSGLRWEPSTSWAQGGPIIDRLNMDTKSPRPHWPHHQAYIPKWGKDGRTGFSGMQEVHLMTGPSTLIAAMRCYVASKLGAEVDIPDALSRDAGRAA